MEDPPGRQRNGWIDSLSERVCVIVNPAAGRGRGARMLPAIRTAFSVHGVTDVLPTSRPGDERVLALDAITNGFTTIISVGGDGTCSNVANAILHSGSDIRLGTIPLGTGNDFARTLGVDGSSMDAIAARAVQTSDARMDVGFVEDSYFLNSCGFGFDVAVLQALGDVRWLTGTVVYVYTALRQLLGFRGLHIAIDSSSGCREKSLYMMLVIANGAHFGGGFVIAPSAVVTDGELDVVSVLDAGAARRLRLLSAARRGRHGSYREVSLERGSDFMLRFDQVPFYQADGEVHQAASTTLRVRCVPRALRVVGGGDFLASSRAQSDPGQ